MNSKLIEDLHAVKAMLPGKWTQKNYGVEPSGQSVTFAHEACICFCLMGAFDILKLRVGRLRADAVQARVYKEVGAITSWNDKPERTEEQVIDMLQGIITKEEASVST